MTRHVVARVGELAPGERKLVRVAGRDVALFRIGDAYHAIQDRCPHEGASLCKGRVVGLATSERPGTYSLMREGELVRCPWHGWEFDIKTGQSWCDPETVRVRSFAASVEQGADVAKGPFVAETFPVTLDDDYVLIETTRAAWIEAVVTSRSVVGDVVLLELARADGRPLPKYEPGAHIDLETAPRVVRQYSLYGDHAGGRYRIAVLLENLSRGGSAAVHGGMAVGSRLRIGSPRCNFPLDPAARRSVLIAGGIGITPIIAMARALERAGGDFTVHYLARSASKAALLDELRDGPIAAHLQTWFGDELPARRFDIDRALAAKPDADVYVCGPDRLTTAVERWWERSGRAAAKLHVERFAPAVSKGGTPFQVELSRSGVTLDVGPDQSIADVLLEIGVPVELSCEQGLCGSCLVPLIAGRAEHRDSVQSEMEKERDMQIAVCCSRAITPVLVLDL